MEHSDVISNNMWTKSNKEFYIPWIIKINDKVVHTFDVKGKNIKISFDSKSIGDTLAWMTIPIWNNLFLMVIMIWIQTGLAMVIFSAALRGIPKEMLEAARIDGASELKIFTSIIIPYLEKTILVIWTIITILVLKIFDIILAMTNGQWNTEVLANLMYDWMFRGGGDSGRGSLMAIVIMIGVIPIMIWNIHRHKEEEKN